VSSSPARISPQARSSGGYGSWLGRDLESLDISSLHFAVAPDPVKVYIDETGLYFGCRRQSRHRSERWALHGQRTHIEDAAVASGRHAVTLRLVQMPATAASVSSEQGRISSKGSDAFRPRTPFISCSSLLRSDARMVDLYRVSTGVEQSSGDLHRAQVYVSSAVLGGAMVGARIAFGPHRK
jgi:hypothetical protein